MGAKAAKIGQERLDPFVFVNIYSLFPLVAVKISRLILTIFPVSVFSRHEQKNRLIENNYSVLPKIFLNCFWEAQELS